MAEILFRWLDDKTVFTKRADLRKGFDDFFATPDAKMDPKEMIDRMMRSFLRTLASSATSCRR